LPVKKGTVQAMQELLDVTRTGGGTLEDQPLPAKENLNHLGALEAESIYILREAFAEFSNPVML
jgi:hypothetical protein